MKVPDLGVPVARTFSISRGPNVSNSARGASKDIIWEGRTDWIVKRPQYLDLKLGSLRK